MKKLLLFAFCICAIFVNAQTVTDIDGDGIPNSSDNCILFANPDQVDDDMDGVGNFCDCNPSIPKPTLHPPLQVYILATPDTIITAGTKVTFTALTQRAGTFEWKKNNVIVGTNSTTYIDSTLQTGDSIICTNSEKDGCDSTIAKSLVSNTLTMTVNSLPNSIAFVSENLGLQIFPNPTSNQIKLNEVYKYEKAILRNSLGQVVKYWTNQNNNQLDIKEIPKGTYFLQFFFEEEIVTRSLIKD
jgi:hypothetical protein